MKKSEPREDDKRHDAEGDDGGGAESQRLETRGRQKQREERSRHDDHRAPEGQLQPPAVANAVDDIDKLRATVGAVWCVEHRGASSHCWYSSL